MVDTDLERYRSLGMDGRATQVEQIDPASVVTGAWVSLKCQFGCQSYGLSYSCPPDSPTPEQTRAVLDCYRRAMLFRFEMPTVLTEADCLAVKTMPMHEATAELARLGTTERSKKRYYAVRNTLMDIEGEAFKDGHYKAFVFLMGSCVLCETCAKRKGLPCSHRYRVRPSMEASGIDVFATARNNGLPLTALSHPWETRNQYALLLVD